jgi:hypothetical protein
MRRAVWCVSFLFFVTLATARAQRACRSVARWSPCEIALELPPGAPNAYTQVELYAEFRGPAPDFRTRRMPAFWAGGRKMMVRFSPDLAGAWSWRISGNVAALEGQEGQFTVNDSEAPGFLRAANLHFWLCPETVTPHLYVGDAHEDLFTMDRASFDKLLAARAAQKFTHLGGTLLAPGAQAYTAPDQPNQAYFDEVDSRALSIAQRGLVLDLTFAPDTATLTRTFPKSEQRERFLRTVVARYGGLNVVWLIAGSFEGSVEGRGVAKEAGLTLRRYDPFNHPGTSGARVTSSALLGDKWVSHIIHNSTERALGLIEHEKYPLPIVNTGFARREATGDEFRKGLWNSTMSGEWPVAHLDALDSADTKAMQVWAETLASTRYWELEPFFEIDGARALGLPGVEYLIYIEKPGELSIFVEKHNYEVYWINPATGARIHEKKEWDGAEFTANPPSKDHDWLLHLSRDGHKAGMARSYKFTSASNAMQEPEVNEAKIPYAVVAPMPDAAPLVAGASVPFQLKLKRETKGTRRMDYLVTGEVVLDGAGSRMLGAGFSGDWTVPADMLASDSGVMNVKVEAVNAAGKLYSLDLVYPVVAKH